MPTFVVQKYVTDAAEIISATPVYRKMFIAEVFRKCNEIAQWEKESGKASPELARSPSTSRKLPAYAVYPNCSDEKFILAGQNKVIDRLLNNYSIPKTPTSPSGSTSAVTVSSAIGESSTATVTAKPAEAEAIYISRLTAEGKLLVLIVIQVTTSLHQCWRRRIEEWTVKPSIYFICTTWYGRRPNQNSVYSV